MRLGKFINTVSEFGIKVCLDKFGTKTSSLSLLNSFHFDTLKMNQDVLNSLLSKNKVNIIFTKALLSITKELNIKVVALGVENSEHLLPLKKLGCKFGQGFYFERPLYHIEFENLLLQEKRFY
jgi:EAL domain-containing protein (putative c-di-GMP-specific phosphodiesterase class I)